MSTFQSSADAPTVTIQFQGGTLRLAPELLREDSAVANLLDAKCEEHVHLPAHNIVTTQKTLDLVSILLHGGSVSTTDDQWVQIAKIADFLDSTTLNNVVVENYSGWKQRDKHEITRLYSGVDSLADKVDMQLARHVLRADETVRTLDDVLKASKLNHVWKSKSFGNHSALIQSMVALDNGNLVTGSEDGTVKIWDTNLNVCIQTFAGHTDTVWALASFPNGRIASGSEDTSINIWDIRTGACLATLRRGDHFRGERRGDHFRGENSSVHSLAVLPDGRLASGHYDGRISLWDLTTNAYTATTFEAHVTIVYALVVLRDGRLASCSAESVVRLWNTETSAVTAEYFHDFTVRSLAILPDGRLVSASYDKSIKLWNTDTNECTATLTTGRAVTFLTVLPDGNFVSGRVGCHLDVWDADRNTLLYTLSDRCFVEGTFCPIAALSDGRVALASNDNGFHLWNTKTRFREGPLGSSEAKTVGLSAELDNGQVVVGYCCENKQLPNSLYVLDPMTGNEKRILSIDRWHFLERICCIKVVSGNTIAIGCSTILLLLDVDKSAILVLFECDTEIRTLTMLPTGLLASGSDDGMVRLWDLQSLTCVQSLGPITWSFEGLEALPDGHLVASDTRGFVHVWSTKSYSTVPAPQPPGEHGLVRLHTPLKDDTVYSYTDRLCRESSSSMFTDDTYVTDGVMARVMGGNSVCINDVSVLRLKNVNKIVGLKNGKLLVFGSGFHVLAESPSAADLFLAMTALGVPARYILRSLQ